MIPLLILALAGLQAQQPPLAAERRGKPFWKALAAECVVPAGESAADLVREAVSLLGSPDSEWRDDVGYGVVASCVYRKKLLRPDERRALTLELSANLLRSLYVLLSLPQPAPTGGQTAARDKLLTTLQQIRR